MLSEKEIRKVLAEVLADDRLYEPPANVFVNAPLAIVQIQLETKIQMLCMVLEDYETGRAFLEKHRVKPVKGQGDEVYICPACGARHEDGGRGKPPVYCDECGADWK